MVEYQLPKLTTRVRFPSSAPKKGASARGRPSLEQMTQTRPGLRFSLRFLVSQSEDAQARVRICAEERVKLACKRQGAKILRFGEIPVLCLYLDPACAFLFVFSSHKARTRKRGFAFAPKSASSSLVSGKAQKYSPLARFPSPLVSSFPLRSCNLSSDMV